MCQIVRLNWKILLTTMLIQTGPLKNHGIYIHSVRIMKLLLNTLQYIFRCVLYASKYHVLVFWDLSDIKFNMYED